MVRCKFFLNSQTPRLPLLSYGCKSGSRAVIYNDDRIYMHQDFGFVFICIIYTAQILNVVVKRLINYHLQMTDYLHLRGQLKYFF